MKQQYLFHMSSQYGELRPTNGSDRFRSLGHPCKFQRVSRLGSITARHCSSGHQPNFAALNRGRHLYSAGRPSRWALDNISSCFDVGDDLKLPVTRIWANAKRDGCPAEYRWHRMFNTAKFGCRPLLECCAVALQRCKTR